MKRAATGYYFIAPWIIGFLVFTAGPMIYSIYLSFTSTALLSPPTWIGVGNYARAVTDDPLVPTSFLNTLFYVALSVPVQVALALGIATLLHHAVRGSSLFRTVIFLPSITNMVAVSVLWMWIFNPEFGLLNAALGWFGIEGPLWLQSEAFAKPALILMSLWGIGGGVIIFLAALQGVPRELYEAAELDHAGSVRKFFHITVPMITPSILFSVVMALIGSFQVFTQAYVMTGGAQPGSEGGPNNATLFFVLYLYKKAFQEFKMGYASALAWMLFAVIFILTLVQMKLSKRWVYYESDRK